VLAPAAKWRASIVPKSSGIESTTGACECEQDSRANNECPRNYLWSTLMTRVFEIDVLKCPDCNGRVKILAAIHSPVNTRKILECMGLPSLAPPIARTVSELTLE